MLLKPLSYHTPGEGLVQLRFLRWCDEESYELAKTPPGVVGKYIRTLKTEPRRWRKKNGLVTTKGPKPASKSMKK